VNGFSNHEDHVLLLTIYHSPFTKLWQRNHWLRNRNGSRSLRCGPIRAARDAAGLAAIWGSL